MHLNRVYRNALNICTECNAKNMFTYDSKRAHYTCTWCGIVPNTFYTDMELGKTFQEGTLKSCIPKATKKTKKQLEHATNLLNNVFYEEFKHNEFMKKLQHFNDYFDCSFVVFGRAQTYFEAKKTELVSIKNMETTAFALMVVSSLSLKMNLTVGAAKAMTKYKHITKKVRKICKLLNVKVAYTALSRLPAICSYLFIEFRDQRKIRKAFLKYKNKNQNVGEDTIMALAVHEKCPIIPLKDICFITNVNINTLENYIKRNRLVK